MSKLLEMSDETKYEVNVYCSQLNRDLTNLMEFLRKQDKDNKAILYVGKHIKKKVILTYEEYQKMCQRLEILEKNPNMIIPRANKKTKVEEMNKEFDTLKELKHWKEINTEKGVTWLPVFVVEAAEKDLIKAQEQKQEFLKREVQLLYDKNFFKEENAELKRVLRIIFEKKVDIIALDISLDVEAYNRIVNHKNELTQKEFELLKRWQNE